MDAELTDCRGRLKTYEEGGVPASRVTVDAATSTEEVEQEPIEQECKKRRVEEEEQDGCSA